MVGVLQMAPEAPIGLSLSLVAHWPLSADVLVELGILS